MGLTRTNLFSTTLLSLLLIALPSVAQASTPNWPENGRFFACSYTLSNGSTGVSTIFFKNLPATAHVFPDGNQIKHGRLVTILPGQVLDNAASLAWKPNELPDPAGGTNFELTLDNGIQCKRFENYGDVYLDFFQCSNGVVQSCQRIR